MKSTGSTDSYNQPISYYLNQALKGEIDHPEFFILYASFLLDIDDAAKAIEITELGIENAPKGSSADDVRDYLQYLEQQAEVLGVS